MKRALYLVAALCFLGTGVCLVRWINVPDEMERVGESMQGHDASARDYTVEGKEASASADDLLRDAGMFLVGGVVCVLLGRRPWPTTDEPKR